jgi:hypothetical protein
LLNSITIMFYNNTQSVQYKYYPFHEMDIHIMNFNIYSRSGRISLSGYPVHMNDFIMWMRYTYVINLV